jgi:DNA mismatch endonuclease, patch repair protein
MNTPKPSSDKVSRQMKAQRNHDTGCELALRRALHHLGLRYFVHRHPLKQLRREADIMFGPTKVAVFIDGCFWHSCPTHGTIPLSNHEWWKTKLERTKIRDSETVQLLEKAGWVVIRVWEHEDAYAVSSRIYNLIQQKREKIKTR